MLISNELRNALAHFDLQIEMSQTPGAIVSGVAQLNPSEDKTLFKCLSGELSGVEILRAYLIQCHTLPSFEKQYGTPPAQDLMKGMDTMLNQIKEEMDRIRETQMEDEDRAMEKFLHAGTRNPFLKAFDVPIWGQDVEPFINKDILSTESIDEVDSWPLKDWQPQPNFEYRPPSWDREP